MREVLEETGVTVLEAEYHSSQPWPFPSSLMIGFIARAAAAEVPRTRPLARHGTLATALPVDSTWPAGRPRLTVPS